MNNLFLVVVLLLCGVLTSWAQDNDTYAAGRTNLKYEGCYVFVFSEPLMNYDHVESIKLPNGFLDGNVDKELEKLIDKARRKYPYFNGIVINNDQKQAELIKFRDLEISSKGYRVGDKVVYKAGRDLMLGIIREVNPSKDKATFAYLDIYGDEKVIERKIMHFTPINDEEYDRQLAEHMEKVERYKYDVGERATWVSSGKPFFGTIKALDDKRHAATLEHLDIFGDVKIRRVPYLDITIVEEDKYNGLLADWQEQMSQYQFTVGETIQWVEKTFGDNKLKEGVIINLNDKTKSADVKYTNNDGEERVLKKPYLQLIKKK